MLHVLAILNPVSSAALLSSRGVFYPARQVARLWTDGLHFVLAGSLGWLAYVRFGCWMVLSFAMYFSYSMHRAEARDIAARYTIEIVLSLLCASHASYRILLKLLMAATVECLVF